MKLIIAIALFVAYATAQPPTAAHQKCAADNVFNECGTACPPTCENPTPSVCTEQCVIGCQCKPGFVKTKDGKCVDRKDCSRENKTCGTNERWSDDSCVHPSPLCQSPQCPNNSIMAKCAAICQQGGCLCKNGFYRDDKQKCVRLNRCNVKQTSTPRPRV